MIIFKKLTFQNFLSAGNRPVEIQLDKSQTTLIHGTNGIWQVYYSGRYLL